MRLRSAWCWFSLLLLGSAQATTGLLVLERRGFVQWRMPASSNQGASWRDVEAGMQLETGSSVRTGETSLVRLWLRPDAKLSLGEKTRLSLGSGLSENRKVHLVRLEEGRVSLEAPRLDGSTVHELLCGEARIRLGLGRLLLSRVAPEYLVQLLQVEGECYVSAEAVEELGGERSPDRLSPLKGVTLHAWERLSIRELRYAKRAYEKLPDEWGFAFPAPRDRPRGNDGFLDKRERWE